MPFAVDGKFVSEAEEKLGVKLPESYRNAMITENGGQVVVASDRWDIIPIFDKSDRKRLARTCNDIVRETSAMRSWTGWLDEAVCIAQNGTGDALIFLTVGDRCPETIYYWDHETGGTKIVANSFADLKRIRP